MKFSVSYSRKVKAGLSYEMLEISASVESDTSVETMTDAFQRVRTFVETKIEEERNRLLDKSVNRPR